MSRRRPGIAPLWQQAVVVVFALAWQRAVLAEPSPPALPENAQQAFERGLGAVEQQAWGLAARYFTEAQEHAPTSPAVLFNLGLAHAKAGNELAAIAWLNAYLAAEPNAQNAEAVRTELARLTQAANDKIRAIFQEAIRAAEAIPDDDEKTTALTHYSYVPGKQAYAGSLEDALATCKRAPSCDEAYWRPWYVARYAESLAEADDLEAAQQFMSQLPGQGEHGNEAWAAIAMTLVHRGKLASAMTPAQRIQSSSRRGNVMLAIASRALDTQDSVLMGEALRQLDTQETSLAYHPELHQLVRILVTQRNDVAGAVGVARQFPQPRCRATLLATIAMAQLERGDRAGAEATAQDILALQVQGGEVDGGDLVAATALLGKYQDALSMTEGLRENYFIPTIRASAFGNIAWIQVLAGNAKGAYQTANRAAAHQPIFTEGSPGLRANLLEGARHYQTVIPPLRIVEAHLVTNDIEHALNVAKPMKDSMEESLALVAIAKAQVAAGDFAGAERTIAQDTSRGNENLQNEARLALASAYWHQQQIPQAMRILQEAIEADWRLPSSGSQREAILEQYAKMLAHLGASLPLSAWVSLARFLSAFDVEEGLTQAKAHSQPEQPAVLVSAIAEVAGVMGHQLIRIHTLEQRFSPQLISKAQHEP